MTRTGCLALLLAASLAACAQSTPEQQIVEGAAEALGGADRILAVSTLVAQGEGTQYNLGQDVVPDASGQTFTLSEGRRATDLSGGRWRMEFTRQPNFTYFQGPAPQRLVQGVDGDVGYNVAANGNANRASAAVTAERQADLDHGPISAVRAALGPGAMVTNARTEGGESLVDVQTAEGYEYTLAVDATTNLPSRVSWMGDNTNLGDIVLTNTFSDYQEVDGLQLPMAIATAVDDFTTAEYDIAAWTVDGDPGDLAAPADAASAPVPGPFTANVEVQELADGVWFLAGQSHHSVVVEFSDHLMLIEAPQNDTRALAVIEEARQLVPDKPLTQLVNTHHHFDHSGGVRAAISEGLAVITHQGNVAFMEGIAERPHTIVPDALQMNPMPLTVEGVEGERVISDDGMTVNLYTVSGAHSQTMLIAYLPQQRLLVEADVYTPGPNAQQFSAEFLKNVQALDLDIDRIVPIHGAVAPYSQFAEEATAAAAN